MSRWVLVDDSDSGISYDGAGWFQDKGSLDSFGILGPPYLSTLHGTQSDGSFSYTFTGTRVFIIGTHQASNSSGVTNPWFQCLVDGESTSVVAPSLPENGLLFCEKDGLSVGQHQISVVVSVSNQQTFWFDYIQYLPTASVSLDNATLWINSTDSQIRYGSGWSSTDVGASTSQNAATLSFQFTGISLTWLGYYNNSQALLLATATYSIDGQTPTSFHLSGATLLNQIMFQTLQLPFGSHKLDIVYQGNSQSTPLTLTALLIQNGDHVTRVAHNSSNLGPIIGAVVVSAEPTVVEPFNQPPTATLALTGSGKSAGTSHILLQHQRSGQVGDGSIPILDRSGESPSQLIRPHTHGISSSIDIPSAEMVQTRSNLEVPGIIQPQKEFQLQSLPVAARNVNFSIQPTRVIHEEDSGIRLPHADGYRNGIEVLPPRYTAG